jgi:ABC-2 type transport system ATP-binding protein
MMGASSMAKGSGSAVKLVGVAKRYADVVAVDHVDLDVKNGAIFGLLGPNGSGKSTLLKIILALVKPDAGSVNVLGTNVEKNPVAIKVQTGYVPEVPRLYEFLTGLEYLDFTADLYGVSKTEKRERINEYLEALELEGREGDMISAYSLGMKQKIALISAFVHKPKLLLLDEPLGGLDPRSARIIKDLLRELTSKGITTIMSTHILEIAQAMCDRITIMHEGKLLATGNMKELREKARLPGSNLEEIFLTLTGTSDIKDVVEALMK